MSADKPPAWITVEVTLEGPTEEILADVQRLKGGQRKVLLSVEVPRRHYSVSDHIIPAIRGGQTQDALEKLDSLASQTVIDVETEQRLERLIREFGRFTEFPVKNPNAIDLPVVFADLK